MRSDNTYLKLILLLTLLGILVSGWLLSVHISFATGQASLTASCGIPGMGAEGCANIAVSRFSDVFGVPLAAIAMGFYFSLLILVFWAMRNYQSAYEPLYVGFFLSTLSIIVTMIMFFISRFVVQSFCIGCAMLWLVNLAIWPCFVMHLKLSWANALAANLELVRSKTLNLRKERILSSFAVGGACLLIFSVIGASAKSFQGEQSRYESSRVEADFRMAPQVFLPAEAYGGPTAKGGTGSKIVMDIVEFADFQCPGCKVGAQFLRPFLMKHGDRVRLTYRNFPLDGSCNRHTPNAQHRLACASARLSICAGAQGKFWEVHDQIFDNQDSLSQSVLDTIAGRAGLDRQALDACLKDPATEAQLQKEIEWGDLIQLQSTPTLVINGKKISGARSPQDLEVLLKSLERESR